MKPSNYLLSLFFSIFCNIIVAQNDYIFYFNYCNEGDEQFYLKNYALALKKYDTAFQSVDFIHTKQLNKYAQTCIKVGDTVKAVDYVRKALINGLDTNVLYQFMYIHLKGNKRIFELKDSTSFFHKEYQKRINQNYLREVDSLQYIDQCFIRRNCEEKRNFKFKYENIPKNKLDLDSLVFSHLIFLVKKYGFPSEKLVGSKEYNIVWVIFHHNVRLPQNEKYIPMVEEAVRKGEIDPSHFAWMYDQGKLNKNEKPFFFYGVADVSIMSESEIKEIDERRHKYGIKPLRSSKIIKYEGGIMQNSIW